jgi:hypothetical protein
MEDKRQEDLDVLYILGSIKRMLRNFFNSVGRVISFSLRNFVRIGFIMLIFVVIGILLSSLIRPYYTSYLSVSHIRLNNEFCSEMIFNLNTYIDGNGNEDLAAILGLSSEKASMVKRLRYKPMNESLSKRYADSLLVLLPFKVEADVYDKAVLDSLQVTVIKYMESNERANKLKLLDQQAYAMRETKLNKEMLELDSLKKLVNNSIVPRGTGNGIILGEPIDPVAIYRNAMDLFERKVELQLKQQTINTFEVIVGFNRGAKQSSPGKLTFALIGALIGYFVGLFWCLKTRKPAITA